jgi:8-oxo-dGTP diphosphatase
MTFSLQRAIPSGQFMNFFRLRILTVFLLLWTMCLHSEVYLERPSHFHARPAIVGCCYLHYQDKILLLHRQDNKAEGNRWGIPGGKLNPNENIIEATIREVFEETGFRLESEKIKYMGKLYIIVHNFHFEYHMFDYIEPIPNPDQVRINFKEHKGFSWITPKDALKMDLITDEATCFTVTFGL